MIPLKITLQLELPGKELYKIQLAVSSKGKGKSGGARVITNAYVESKKFFFSPFMIKAKGKILTIRK
jgi:hypothetical protein